MKKSFSLILAAALFCASCGKNPSYVRTSGFAQGTTWHITYKSFDKEDLTPKFDSILKAFDFSMSSYNKESRLTKLNENSTDEIDENFAAVFASSEYLYKLSGGLFDPTCRPLVNAWGFNKHKDLKKPKQSELDSILEFVGMDKVKVEDGRLKKTDPRLTLNFNANAQGYSVDLLCMWLKGRGYEDFLVEVGGEVRAFGKNSEAQPWRVGIDTPIDGSTENDREISAAVPLENKSLCTSGDYRNFFVIDGKKYSHELNPKTGYPKDDSLLSVSVVTPDALFGDGLATAVMVLGLEKGFKLVDSLPEAEGFFIYSDKNGNFKTLKTKGFEYFDITKP
ncbi:MAG: FAD:protein FMN transferase [Bacteroidales bacterium]|nr:FAD:protein FMN transferase [Bacteroidales bacterium]